LTKLEAKMGRAFGFALFVGAILVVVISVNIISSTNIKRSDHMTMGGVKVKNVVLFVGSGLGPSGFTLARGFQETLRQGDASVPSKLSFEPFLVATLRTHSFNDTIPDVAAAASALATGKKAANGMLAVDPVTKEAVPSILERAKQAGLRTGIVTTGELTGAGVAAFTIHADNATMPSMVANSQLDAKIDLLLGGGKPYYTANQGKAWTDASYTILNTPDELEKANTLPALGLFADKGLDFAIDQKQAASSQPTLAQMTRKAIELLRNDKGFILVIESANIDECAYAMDPACLAREVLALQDSFNAISDLIMHTQDTVCLIASDRDSGGLIINSYQPFLLVSSLASVQTMSDQIRIKTGSQPKEVISQATGIQITDIENNNINSVRERASLASTIGGIISDHVGVSWGSDGDTGMDVNLYVCGDVSEGVPRGNVDNTAVAIYITSKVLTMSTTSGNTHSDMHTGGGHTHH